MKIQTELTPLVVQAQGPPRREVMTAWHQYVKARAGVSDSGRSRLMGSPMSCSADGSGR